MMPEWATSSLLRPCGPRACGKELHKEIATVRQVSTAAVTGVSNLATRVDLLSGEVADIRRKIDAEPP